MKARLPLLVRCAVRDCLNIGSVRWGHSDLRLCLACRRLLLTGEILEARR